MVQIVPRPPSRFESTFGAFNQGLGRALEGGADLKKAFGERQTREALAERFGDEFKNIKNPDIQKMMLQGELGKESQKEKAEAEALSLPDYQTVEKHFGKDFADLYKASPTGGKTELLKAGLDATLRGENIKDMFAGIQRPSSNQLPKEFSEETTIPQMKDGRIPPDFKFPDMSKRPQGFTPKEWADERKTWGKENSAHYEESRKRISSLDRDLLGTNKLIQLNNTGKVGEGFERFLINPTTGDFYKLAQLTGNVPKEAQQWVKEIARFGNRAKDAFGSRVTNFDLQQYMKQFPGLLNTSEGRSSILRMMKINYELDKLYEDARQQIYRKVGRNNISPEAVDTYAQEFIKDEKERLESEFLSLDKKNEEMEFQGQSQEKGRRSLEDIFG